MPPEGSVADVGDAAGPSVVGDCWGWFEGTPAFPAACRLTTSCSNAELISRRTVTRAFSRLADRGESGACICA